MQKSVVFIYKQRMIWKEIKKIIQFIITSESIKYLGINLTKEVKSLYTENYQTFLKEIEEYIPCSWIGRITIVKMSILSNYLKWSTHSVQSLWKIPMVYFAEVKYSSWNSFGMSVDPK